MELIDHMPVTRRDGKLIVGEGVKFERIRRITGYLVGTVDRFNNAKRVVRVQPHDGLHRMRRRNGKRPAGKP